MVVTEKSYVFICFAYRAIRSILPIINRMIVKITIITKVLEKNIKWF